MTNVCSGIFKTSTAKTLNISDGLSLRISESPPMGSVVPPDLTGSNLILGRTYYAYVTNIPIGFPADAQWGLVFAPGDPADVPDSDVQTQCNGLVFKFQPTRATKSKDISYIIRSDVYNSITGIEFGKQTLVFRFHVAGTDQDNRILFIMELIAGFGLLTFMGLGALMMGILYHHRKNSLRSKLIEL